MVDMGGWDGWGMEDVNSIGDTIDGVGPRKSNIVMGLSDVMV
jgi:hypothetical protein